MMMNGQQDYGAEEIIHGVNGQDASVRSILSRMVKAGELHSPARGRYRRTMLGAVREIDPSDFEGVIDESDASGLPNAAQDVNLT